MSTKILMILDRSGSMGSIRDDTIGGVNAFIGDQKKQPGKARFTLVQFDNEYEVVHDDVPLDDEVKPLDTKTFVPRGSTALLDAVGRSICDADAKIAALDEQDRPHKVIVVIITDGQENCSREWKRDKVRLLIEEREKSEEREWHFMYLGANQDSFAEAGSMGIRAGSTSNYCGNSADIHDKYLNASRLASSHRTGIGAKGFTAAERKTKN
jgi:uncharacterized protein YegL